MWGFFFFFFWSDYKEKSLQIVNIQEKWLNHLMFYNNV